METIAITYEARTAGLAAPDRFWLAAHIQALPDGHPTKRLVTYMALFARDILTGAIAGPYSDERAQTFARLALVDTATYAAQRHRPDAELAAELGLPVAEMPAVRGEQAAVQRRPAARPRTPSAGRPRHARR